MRRALVIAGSMFMASPVHAGPYGFGMGDENDRREAYSARASSGPSVALGYGWNRDGEGRLLPALGIRTIGYRDGQALARPRSAAGLEVGFRNGEVRPQLKLGFGLWHLLVGAGVGVAIDEGVAFLVSPELSLPLALTMGEWRPTVEPYASVEFVGGDFEHRAHGGVRVTVDWP